MSRFLSTREGKLAAAAIVVALALRIALVAANPLTLSHDPLDYHHHAVSIAHGHGYPPSHYAPGGGPSAFRAPGYPYFLAGVYALSGDSVEAARIIQAFLGAVMVGLIGFIALRLFGPRPALVALWLAAVYPPLVLSSYTLISEAIFLPLVLGALALALHLRASPRPGWRGAALVGLLVGLAVHARSVGAILLLPLAIALLGPRPDRLWRRLRLPAVMALATLLTVTPWLVRNVVVMHKLIYSTETFYFVAATFNDVSKRDNRFPAASHPFALPQIEPAGFRERLKEVPFEERLRKDSFRFIRHNPGYVPKAAYYNTLRMLDLSGGHKANRRVYANLGIGARGADVAIYSWYAMALLAALGLFTRAARAAPRFVWLVPVLLLLMPALVQGISRFRLPAEPFVVMLAALALVAVADRARDRGFALQK